MFPHRKMNSIVRIFSRRRKSNFKNNTVLVKNCVIRPSAIRAFSILDVDAIDFEMKSWLISMDDDDDGGT